MLSVKVLVDADPIALPVAYALTYDRLSIKTGIPRSTLHASFAYDQTIYRNGKKYRVEVITFTKEDWNKEIDGHPLTGW